MADQDTALVGFYAPLYGDDRAEAERRVVADSAVELARDFLINFDSRDAAALRMYKPCDVALLAATVIANVRGSREAVAARDLSIDALMVRVAELTADLADARCAFDMVANGGSYQVLRPPHVVEGLTTIDETIYVVRRSEIGRAAAHAEEDDEGSYAASFDLSARDWIVICASAWRHRSPEHDERNTAALVDAVDALEGLSKEVTRG